MDHETYKNAVKAVTETCSRTLSELSQEFAKGILSPAEQEIEQTISLKEIIERYRREVGQETMSIHVFRHSSVVFVHLSRLEDMPAFLCDIQFTIAEEGDIGSIEVHRRSSEKRFVHDLIDWMHHKTTITLEGVDISEKEHTI